MSAQYQRFLKVIEKWPVDKSKAGRDLGEQLRKQVQILVNPAATSSSAAVGLDKKIDSLDRLAKNNYAKQYPRKLTSTATGLTAEQCNQVLSSEFLQYLNEDRGILSRD